MTSISLPVIWRIALYQNCVTRAKADAVSGVPIVNSAYWPRPPSVLIVDLVVVQLLVSLLLLVRVELVVLVVHSFHSYLFTKILSFEVSVPRI